MTYEQLRELKVGDYVVFQAQLGNRFFRYVGVVTQAGDGTNLRKERTGHYFVRIEWDLPYNGKPQWFHYRFSTLNTNRRGTLRPKHVTKIESNI